MSNEARFYAGGTTIAAYFTAPAPTENDPAGGSAEYQERTLFAAASLAWFDARVRELVTEANERYALPGLTFKILAEDSPGEETL